LQFPCAKRTFSGDDLHPLSLAPVLILTSAEWPAIVAIALGFTGVGFLICIVILGKGAQTQVSQLLLSGASDWQRAEQQIQETQARYRQLVEYSQGLICTHDMNGSMLSVNPAAARNLGYAPAEIVGRPLGDFLEPSKRHLVNGYLKRLGNVGHDDSFLPVISKSGEKRIWQYSSVIHETGGDSYVIGYAQDVTELMRARDELKRRVVSDELTGLYNRRGFFTLAEHALKTAKREGKSCILICADVDGLKLINESLGQAVGSQLLEDTARILRKVFRESDVVARIGSDEFAILAPDNDPSKSGIILGRLQAQIDAFNLGSGRPFKMSVTAGVACYTPEKPRTIQELVHDADENMHVHKRQLQFPLKLESA
jgi:diguanylate cyclase (GGDEF)-like protein/PAS domain S-box-containing protein